MSIDSIKRDPVKVAPKGESQPLAPVRDFFANAFDSLFVPNSCVEACKKGPFVFERAVKRGGNINETDEKGRTALWHACVQGDKKMIDLLFELGADPNIQDEKGNTVLHLAVCSKDPALAKRLVDEGADLHLLNDEAVSPARGAHANPNFRLEQNRWILEQIPLSGFDRKQMATMIYSNAYSCKGAIFAEDQFFSVEGDIPFAMREFFYEGLEEFAKAECEDDSQKKQALADITQAFRLSDDPTISDREMVQRIRSGELTFLEGGWNGHTVEICFFRGYMAICNRGANEIEYGTFEVFKIRPEKMTESLLQDIRRIRGAEFASGIKFHYEDLPGRLEGKRDPVTGAFVHIEPKEQQSGCCSIASPKAAFRFAWVMHGLELPKEPTTFKERLQHKFNPPEEKEFSDEQRRLMERRKQESKLFTNFLPGFAEEKYKAQVFTEFFHEANLERINYKKSKFST